MKTSGLILLLAVGILQIYKSECELAGSGANSDDEDEEQWVWSVESQEWEWGIPDNKVDDNFGDGSYVSVESVIPKIISSTEESFDFSSPQNTCDDYEENSPVCNGAGSYGCGICACSPDRFGNNCECDADNLKLNGDIEDGCRPDPNTKTLCNNRGDCICGKCECYPGEVEGEQISGDFCECDNFSCDRNDEGLLCSGPDHGECVCGKCSCNSEWDVEGFSACECRAGQESCITPHGEHIGKVCSGRGTCTCGECTCEVSQEGEYGGRYCEECPNCPDRCAELKPCVECQVFNSGEYLNGENEFDEFGIFMCDMCPFRSIEVDHMDYYIKNDERLCPNNVDEDGCRFSFAYGYTQWGQLSVWVQRKKECP